jgi:membrane-associated protein
VNLLHPLLLGLDWMDPNWLLDHYGSLFFWVTLGIIVVECGLFFPLLPGDSLLFAVGLFVATGQLELTSQGKWVDLLVILVFYMAAAMLGNVMGYEIGRRIGPPILKHEGRIIKKEYFQKSHEFFEKHGAPALIVGRFVPIVRTFVTVIAGVSEMARPKFLIYSAIGAVLWVLLVTLLGFFLGATFPWLGDKIDVVIILIIAVSLVPVLIEWWRHRSQAKKAS